MQRRCLAFAFIAGLLAGSARAEDELRLADTTERLTAAEEKAARRAVCENGPTITSRQRHAPRALVVPQELQNLYNEKPRATVRLLLRILDGGRNWDSIHAAACIDALVESPEFAAVTAQGANDKTWDDGIGGVNPLTFRAHCRAVCVKRIAAKEKGKVGAKDKKPLDAADVEAEVGRYVPRALHENYDDGRWATFDAVELTIVAPAEWKGANLVVYCAPGNANPLLHRPGVRCSFRIRREYLAGESLDPKTAKATAFKPFDGALENLKEIKH